MAGVSYAVKTSDGAVGTSGTPKVVYGVHIVSSGSAGNVVLRNGTTTSDTAVFDLMGAANGSSTVNFGPDGVVFPSGCYYDEDANVTSTTIIYREL